MNGKRCKTDNRTEQYEIIVTSSHKTFKLYWIIPSKSIFSLSVGFPFTLSSEWSSTDVPTPVDAAELVRDAPLYPVLRDEHLSSDTDLADADVDELIPETSVDTESSDDVTPEINVPARVDPETTPDVLETEHATNVQSNDDSRVKRSAGQQWDRTHKVSKYIYQFMYYLIVFI